MKKFLGLLIFVFLITENSFAKCKKEAMGLGKSLVK